MLKRRFVYELALPALKAAAAQVVKDYAAKKPANYDKMKKREKDKCGWCETTAKYIDDMASAITAASEETLEISRLNRLAGNLTPAAAHKAWRIEAVRRHPDQGGDAQASAVFGAVWDRVEPLFAKD